MIFKKRPVDYYQEELIEIIDERELKRIRSMKMAGEKGTALADLLKSAIVSSSAGMVNGEVRCFTGCIYEKITRNECTAMLEDLICKIGFSWMASYTVEKRIESWYRILFTRQLIVNNDVVVFPNGVLDLRTGLFANHDRRYVQTYMMGFDYKETATSPLWEEFLMRVIPDKVYRDTLQMFLGACFVNRQKDGVKFEKMLVLKGRGANGKSVIFDVLQSMFGSENFTSAKLQDMIQSASLRLNVIDAINGKRLNYSSELKFSKRDAANDTLKAIISGETLQAKKPFGYLYQADRIPLLMANSNDCVGYDLLPYSMRRRIMIIPMDVSIPKNEQDVLLAEKLCRDSSSIFNWIMLGRQRLMERNYHIDSEVAMTEQVMSQVDSSESVGMWLTTAGYYPPSYNKDANPRSMGLYELYEEYKEYCDGHAYNAYSIKTFSVHIKKTGFEKYLSGGYVRWRFLDRNMVLEQSYKDKLYRFEQWMLSRSEPYTNSDGKTVVKSLAGLAVLARIQYRSMRTLFDRGAFEGYYVQEGKMYVFEVNPILDILKRFSLTDVNGIEEVKSKIAKEQRKERLKFNAKMKRLNLPYRKYLHRKDVVGKYILVPQDFEYNNKQHLNDYLSMFEDEGDDYSLENS